jgi:hypothetical protein
MGRVENEGDEMEKTVAMTRSLELKKAYGSLKIEVELVTAISDVTVDGDAYTRHVVRIDEACYIDGRKIGRVTTMSKPVTTQGVTIVAYIEDWIDGKRRLLAMDAADLAQYQAMVAELETAPEYIAMLAAERAADAFVTRQRKLTGMRSSF